MGDLHRGGYSVGRGYVEDHEATLSKSRALGMYVHSASRARGHVRQTHPLAVPARTPGQCPVSNVG